MSAAKRILLVLDGIADEPIDLLDGKTPLEIAKIPNLKALAQTAEIGRLKVADPKIIPSEETTCLGLLGYGGSAAARGPLSAAAMDLRITNGEWLLACRLVTVHDDKLVDSRAGEIGERESAAIFESLNRFFKDRDMRVYTGDGRRHVLAIKADEAYAKLGDLDLRGPDEMIGREIWGAWSKSAAGARLKAVLAEAAEMLETHEINKVRVDLNENPANALWVWGAGKALHLDPFAAPGKTVILSSSDVWKGAAKAAGIEWAAAEAAARPEPASLAEVSARLVTWTKTHDLVILHLDEADRAGMAGDFKKKIRWIEAFDQHLVAALRERVGTHGGTRIAVVSGHVTSSARRERASSEAPFLVWDSGVEAAGAVQDFTEDASAKGSKPLNADDFLKKLLK